MSGTIVLGVIGSVFALAVVGLVVAAAVSNSRRGPPVIERPCSEVIDLNVPIVIGVSEGVGDCVYLGNTGSYYYLNGVTGWNGDLVVANFPTDPKDVCIQYCDNNDPTNCNGDSSGGIRPQALYDNCIYQLVTKYQGQCVPPAPLAIKGTQPYYPYSPFKKICEN